MIRQFISKIINFEILLKFNHQLLYYGYLIMRFYIMYFWPEVWDSLWLLHDTFGLNSKIGLLLNLLGSLPLIFIVVWSTSERDILGSLLISLLRIPKLLRFREIWQISKTYLKSGKEGFQGYFRVFRAIFSLIINTHIIEKKQWSWDILGTGLCAWLNLSIRIDILNASDSITGAPNYTNNTLRR